MKKQKTTNKSAYLFKPEAKARLRTGGFEEEKNNCTDSPTNSREDIWVVIALTSSKKWTKKSGNIKTSRV